MNYRSNPEAFGELFGLKADHSLKLSSKQRCKRNGDWFESHWLDEHDEHSRIVARYHTWTRHSSKPPYRSQVGWERYSLSGDMLDREVRCKQNTGS